MRVFAWLYVRLTRPGAQRQELAADALSAALAGRDTAIAMLEKIHVTGPLYGAYLDDEVGLALNNGVMPVDLLDGFARFRARFVERGLEAQLAKAVAEQKTDVFDTHPALSDRVAFLRALPEGTACGPETPARDLLDPRLDLDAFLVDATWARVDVTRLARPRVTRLRWDDFIGAVLPAVVREDAQALGHAIAQLPRDVQHELALALGARVVATFFQAALVERGGEIVALLGESAVVLRYEGETLRPAEIASGAMRDGESRQALRRWAERIGGLPAPGTSAAA